MSDVFQPDSSRRLTGALGEIGDFLGNGAVNDADYLFVSEMRSGIAASLPSAEADLTRLIEQVEVVDEQELERVGLTGVELDAKLTGFKSALQRFKDARGWRDRRARKWFVRVCGWINSLLGSLAKAIPAAGEILKEFKEMLENSAADRIAQEDEDG